jgi:hypothetical protein
VECIHEITLRCGRRDVRRGGLAGQFTIVDEQLDHVGAGHIRDEAGLRRVGIRDDRSAAFRCGDEPPQVEQGQGIIPIGVVATEPIEPHFVPHPDRLIVTSAAYRQASRHRADFAEIDADNRYLWRMNRRRLDAESVRDSVLQIAHTLDTTMGGPSVKQFIQSAGVHVTPNADYVNYDADHPDNHRRSVYRFLLRTVPDPFMEVLDCPDSSQLTPQRTESVTPLQALAMLNGRFMIAQSEHIAQRSRSSNNDLDAQCDFAFRAILGRIPNGEEARTVRAYAKKHGLSNACRYLLNSNEFIFVD